MLLQITKLADTGQLEQASAELAVFLNEPDLTPKDRAQGLLLYGRCQCGRLASAQATIAFKEAADCFEAAGEPELAEYARAMQLRHLLDLRRIRDIEAELDRIYQVCAEYDWPLARSIADLYTGQVAVEQRRFNEAAEYFIRALATPDPFRTSWEERLIRIFLESAITRGELDPADYAGFLPGPDSGDFPGVPRIALQQWITRISQLYVTNQFEPCRQQLHKILDYLDTAGGEWAGRLRWRITLETNLGNVYEELGDTANALMHHNSVIEKARKWGFPYLEHLALYNRACLLLWAGQPEPACADLLKCTRYFKDQSPFPLQISSYNLAIAQLTMGDTAAAVATWNSLPPLPDSPETNQWRRDLAELLQLLFPSLSNQADLHSDEATGIARGWLAGLSAVPEDDPSRD